MSIVYDYADIGEQMKGDTWWQAEKPESAAKIAPSDEILFLEGLSQSIPKTFVFRTSLPPASWRKLNPVGAIDMTAEEIEAMARPPLVAKPLEIKAGHICSVKLPDGSRWPTFDAVERAAKSLRSSSWLRH